ncbi:hypothetical protein [Tsukamurella soli]|uniref:hypothetical protein n=1 Tax=Tsukamurella soli TaxID=644556 RepID=UPI003606165E
MIAIVVVLVAVFSTGSRSTSSDAAAPTVTGSPETTSTAPTPQPGPALPSITIPNIPGLGSSPTAGGGDTYTVQVTGSGTAQVVAVGVPGTDMFGTKTLPWSKSFTTTSPLVSITVLGFQGPATCSITKNGSEITHNSSTGGMLMCNG